MKIEQIYTNCLAEATYYIESKGEVAIIDPLRDNDQYLEKAKEAGAKIKYIFETHFHADFVSGHVDLAGKTGAKIIFGPTAQADYEIYEAQDGEEFMLGDVKIKVLHTPGHTFESSTFLLIDSNGRNHSIFTGDTLFIGDVGRPDLAAEKKVSREDLAGMLYDSLRTKIMPLEDYLMVYPAHGAGSACGKNMSKDTFSTLGEQKSTNYALQDIAKEEFVKQVTDGILPPPQYFPNNVILNKRGSESIDVILRRGMCSISIEYTEKEVAEGALILDTRHQTTFCKGYIPGSINIGLDGAFAIWAGTLIHDINQKIIIVAEEGREKEALTRLSRIGYDNTIGYIKGGIGAWAKKCKSLDQIESISADELAVRLGQSGLNILDVRKLSEFESGHVKTAKNFPLDYIHERLQELCKNMTYYLHCQGGYRSMIACSILKARGFKYVIDIAGGFMSISRSEIYKE